MAAKLHRARLFLGRVPVRPNAELAALLGPQERRRMKRYAREADRIRYANAHGMVRTVLAAAAGTEPCALDIRYDSGKPWLAFPPAIHFSIGYSRDRVALLLARKPCGVDVEYVDLGSPEDLGPAALFHPREQARIFESPSADRSRRFYAIWTRKEAVVKARGVGVGLDFSSFSVETDGAPVLFEKGMCRPISSWAIGPVRGFQLAVAL